MSLLGKMKLQKLTIKAYKTRIRSSADFIDSFEAMYNPGSFSQKYEIEYSGKLQQAYNSTGQTVKYSRSKPRELNIKLILDGTGVEQMGISLFKAQKTVSDRVKDFIALTFRMNGEIHEPNFLVVEWGGKPDGGLIFSCRLGSVNVTYNSFNRDGSPLRAELDVTLISDQDVKKRMREENKKSPDLSRTCTVQAGDTLPLLRRFIISSWS
ncbi:MAG: hypothetical protein D3922_14810 [Candidatus Electrothrix sp. AR1]|nr:hypothetical protein [Candidatus Electrothrix sp. AR1]